MWLLLWVVHGLPAALEAGSIPYLPTVLVTRGPEDMPGSRVGSQRQASAWHQSRPSLVLTAHLAPFPEAKVSSAQVSYIQGWGTQKAHLNLKCYLLHWDVTGRGHSVGNCFFLQAVFNNPLIAFSLSVTVTSFHLPVELI